MNGMNWPNAITFSRLLSVPFIVWLILNQQFKMALILFFFAGVSDLLDGFLARTLQVGSRLGAYLDPVADKILLISVFTTLWVEKKISGWLAGVIVGRDLLILGGVIFLFFRNKSIPIYPLDLSKINTALQMTVVVMCLGVNSQSSPAAFIFERFFSLLQYVTAFTTVWSGWAYGYQGWKFFQQERKP